MKAISITVIAALISLVIASVSIAADLTEDFDALLKVAGVRGWEIYEEAGATDGPAAWSVAEVDGKKSLLQSSNIYTGDANSDSPARATWATYVGGDWADVTLEVDMYATDNDIPGVIFRYVDENNFYVFDMNGQASRTTGEFGRVQRCVGGVYTELTRQNQTVYTQSAWLAIKIEAIGNSIKVSTDGVLLIDVTDSDLDRGTIGVSSWGVQSVAFDNIRVNGAVIDDFEDVELGGPVVPGWIIYDEPGANSSPSSWNVVDVDGQIALVESSNIYGDNNSRGSWVYYENGDWSDAVFEVDMFAMDDDLPGVLFRYVDENNFYVFDMNGQASRDDGLFGRLRKCVNGEYAELGYIVQTMFEKDDGIWHHIKVEMLSDNIKVSLDNEEIFDVTDADIPSGSIAVSSWGMSPGVAFDNVLLTDLAALAVNPGGKLTTTWGTLKR